MNAGLLIRLSTVAVLSAQGVPAIPAKPGTAAGTVQAGGATVKLVHAYASGPIDWGGTVYQIVLTDAPVAESALAKELQPKGGLTLLRSRKVSGVALLIDDSGLIRNLIPFIGDLRGSAMLSSAGSVSSFAVRDGRVVGQHQRSADSTMGQGWSYAASWNAVLRKPQ